MVHPTGNPIAPIDTSRAQKFVRQVDPSRLAGLTVTEIRFPNAKFEHDEQSLANAAATAAV